MATKQVSIPEIGTVTLYKRRGNRSLRLSIGPGGEVRVSLPYWLPYKAGEQFARAKQTWIEANRVVTTAITHGQAVGKAHRIMFVPSVNASASQTRLQGNEIQVIHPLTTPNHHTDVQQAANKASIRALRKEAQALLPQRLQALADQHGFEYTGVSVKQLKSRWGSCNSFQEITLNLFLMQLPWRLIDYVLMHELIHTKIMQHGAPFWEAFESHMPDARQLRHEMKAYQPALQAQRIQ